MPFGVTGYQTFRTLSATIVKDLHIFYGTNGLTYYYIAYGGKLMATHPQTEHETRGFTLN